MSRAPGVRQTRVPGGCGRGARPALLLPSHAQPSAPSTGQPAGPGIKIHSEKRVAIISAAGNLGKAPFLAPSPHWGPSRVAGGSRVLGCTRERLDSTERPRAPGICICKVPNRWVHLLEHVHCAHTYRCEFLLLCQQHLKPSPEAHVQRR